MVRHGTSVPNYQGSLHLLLEVAVDDLVLDYLHLKVKCSQSLVCEVKHSFHSECEVTVDTVHCLQAGLGHPHLIRQVLHHVLLLPVLPPCKYFPLFVVSCSLDQ